MKNSRLLLAISLAVPCIAIAQATTASAIAGADHNFMREAAQAGKAELQASRLAVTKASDPAVKEFARLMVEDHTQADAKLAQVAQSKGVTLPTDPSADQKSVLKSLEGQSGAAFDKRYMDEFGVKAHQQTVSLFRKEADGGQDNDVKAFAQQTLPTLEKHLKHAVGMPKQGAAQ